MTTLGSVDYAVMALYFAFVLGIGAALRRYVHTSEDFFLSGRAIPAWVTGLAFVSANLGAQEVIGMGASGAKYGIATSHFYWIGAIPAMVFIGLFMMPFYYGSRARSVPEYLKLRFDEKTRALNAVSFAVMTVFSSGISLYAMGKLLHLLLGWSFDLSIFVDAGVVLADIFLGGLTSAIYNEVLQFFLIVLGFAPLVFLGLRAVGGWSGLVARLADHATATGFAPGAYTRSWAFMGHSSTNPVGVEWFGDEGGAPGGGHRVRGHGALYHQEIGAPIPERQHEAQSHHQAEPLDAHGVGGRVSHERPAARIGAGGEAGGGGVVREPRHQSRPAAHGAQPQ